MLNNPILLGTKLPVLSNPGTAADLFTGKQLIGNNGAIITGTMPGMGDLNKALYASSITIKNQAANTIDVLYNEFNSYLALPGYELVMAAGTTKTVSMFPGFVVIRLVNTGGALQNMVSSNTSLIDFAMRYLDDNYFVLELQNVKNGAATITIT